MTLDAPVRRGRRMDERSCLVAGDWIKVETTLPDKPEVIAIAARLDIDPDAVVGKLVRFWSWADQHTVDGNAAGVTKTFLDRCAAVTGFADALESVGWLSFQDGVMRIPNFDHHNGQTGKSRALTARRVAKHKSKSNAKGNARSVTRALPREEKEKRRDIIASPKGEACGEASSPPTAIMEFPCVGKGPKSWQLIESKLAEYRESYPGVDVLAECRQALQWCRDNPSRRKTFDGMPQFLNRWLKSEQNRLNIAAQTARPLLDPWSDK